MDHSEVESLLVDAALDRLPPDSAAEVWRHAGSCTECLDHIVAALSVRSALRADRPGASAEPEGPAGPHLSPDALSAWALGQAADEPRAMLATARHLVRCASCRREVSLLRAAERSSRPRDGFESWFGWLRPPVLGGPSTALATAAAVVVLAWPAYLSLVELPRVRGELEGSRRALERNRADTDALARSLIEQRPSASTPRLLVLRDALRGAEAPPSAPQAAAGTSRPLLLAYPFDRWLREAPDARCVVAIARTDGAEVLHLELPVRELWDAGTGTGVLVVASHLLPPGRYRLTVEPAPQGPARMAAEFEITPPEPAR